MKKTIIWLFDFLFPVQNSIRSEPSTQLGTIATPSLISIDEYKFAFAQAEKQLEDSHKTYDATTAKSVTLITFGVAVFSTLVTYFFLQNDIRGHFDPKLFTVLVLCFYSFSVLYYLIRNILPTNYLPSGSLPSDLLNAAFFENNLKDNNDIDHENVLRDMYYSELVNYDHRIDTNYEINNNRLTRLRYTIIALLMLPIVGLAVYLLTALIHHHLS